MKYMLLIYHDEPSWNAITEPERQQVYLEFRKLRSELEAKDLDEATSIAARIPSARTGTIEVRPLVETAGPATA